MESDVSNVIVESDNFVEYTVDAIRGAIILRVFTTPASFVFRWIRGSKVSPAHSEAAIGEQQRHYDSHGAQDKTLRLLAWRVKRLESSEPPLQQIEEMKRTLLEKEREIDHLFNRCRELEGALQSGDKLIHNQTEQVDKLDNFYGSRKSNSQVISSDSGFRCRTCTRQIVTDVPHASGQCYACNYGLTIARVMKTANV